MTTALQAVESSFTGILKRTVLAEGNRVHANRLLKYEPENSETQIRKRKKGKKEIIIAAQKFSDGISDLTSLTFNNQASLQDESKKMVREFLEDLAVKISDLVQSRRKGNITQNDITNAVEHLLPEELARHAIAEGARMLLLYQNGVLEARSKTVAKTEMSRKARKRTRSPLVEVETTLIAKRRKRSISRKKSSKKAPKRTSRSKKKTRKSPKTRSRKRSVSKEAPITKRRSRKRSVSKGAPITKRRSRKRSVSKEAPITKRRSTKATKSKKSVSSSRRKKSRTRKSPRRVSPKTVRKISEKQPKKKKTVSKKETTRKISSVVKTEIKSGMKKLNKSYKLELSTAGEELISQCLYNLLNYLSDAMRKDKIPSVGPMEVRRAVIKVFPKELADSAIAEMSRVLMTT